LPPPELALESLLLPQPLTAIATSASSPAMKLKLSVFLPLPGFVIDPSLLS
jgi:hypothetical protein